MKKILKRVVLIICSILVVAFAAITILFLNEIKSLASLKKVSDYPQYTMTYYGDYGFDEFLKTGAKSDADIEKFVTKRLLKGVPLDLGVTGDGCTAFVTKDEKGHVIYGRNFDFDYTPSLQLLTTPKNGYRSISTVNLSFAGYTEDNLPDGISLQSFLALSAPYLPFDGMNEKGLAIALLAVPDYQYNSDESKVTLNTTTAIRLVLDKAATVEEAVALLKQYNIYFSADVDCHYLIADATGKSVLVEYWDGALQTVTSSDPYQIASNFIAFQGLNIGEGGTEFDRYNKVKQTLDANQGLINDDGAIRLLSEIGCYDGEVDKLQWSVVYDLTDLNGSMFVHRDTSKLRSFALTPARP